jgi:tetratricopeptide (TPR) repeat protein
MAARLHKALETYPVPRHLRAQGKTTKPVFRDIAELTAAHSLSEKIREAVKGSRVLIVLCSPAAKASHWVNEEIKLFRAIHGTPDTAFPAALTAGGREPLAAALGADKTGFKLGVTQLAAGMLGTGLDDLVQRGAKRRQKIMGAGMAASLALSGVMGFATLQAVEARKEAESARGDAEGLVEYMIKDLKFKLEPVGRLDLLEGIGDKAVEYYDKQDIKQLPDDSLTRQAAARQVLAQVHLDAGRMEDAQREIEASADLTREVLARNPEDTDAIFAHAQSEFWVGAYFNQQGKLVEVEKAWREYDRLAQILYKKDPTNFDWVMEAAWGKNNLAALARRSYLVEKMSQSLDDYSQSINLFEQAIKLKPNSKIAKKEMANVMGGKAFILLYVGNADDALSQKHAYLNFLSNLTEKYPDDFNIKEQFLIAKYDYFNGYFLYHNERQKKDIISTLDNLYELLNYDSKDMTKKVSFLIYIFNLIESLDLAQLQLREIQVKEVFKIYSEEKYLKYYDYLDEVIDIKIHILKDEISSANIKLDKLSKAFVESELKIVGDWRLYYFISNSYNEVGNKYRSKVFAKKFLDALEKTTELNPPTIIAKKINALALAEDCGRIKPLEKVFQSRGYNQYLKNSSSLCSIED